MPSSLQTFTGAVSRGQTCPDCGDNVTSRQSLVTIRGSGNQQPLHRHCARSILGLDKPKQSKHKKPKPKPYSAAIQARNESYVRRNGGGYHREGSSSSKK